jgi:hypothetical protein
MMVLTASFTTNTDLKLNGFPNQNLDQESFR